MKKRIISFLVALLVLSTIVIAPLVTTKSVVQAQTTTQDSDYNYDSDYDFDNYDLDDYDYSDSYTTSMNSGDEAMIMAFMAAYMGFILLITVVAYIFGGIIFSKIAKKLNHPSPWWAWVPILNVVQLFQLGDQNPLLVILLFIPIINFIALVFFILAMMNIAEKMGQEKWIGIVAVLVPFANIIIPAMWAFGDYPKGGTVATKEANPVQS